MKNAVTGLTTMVLLVSALVTEAREIGHYAPGVVSIRDLAVPPVPGFFMHNTTLITRPIATLMATVTSVWTLSLKTVKSSWRPMSMC